MNKTKYICCDFSTITKITVFGEVVIFLVERIHVVAAVLVNFQQQRQK